MYTFRLAIFTFISITLLFGCATQGVNTIRYTPSAYTRVNNEISVSRQQSQVWDKLVKELSKSFFVINNIDKESRIINISFFTDSPEQYIDCGKSYRTYTQGDKVEHFVYETAESSKYKHATPKQPAPAFAQYVLVIRSTSLEGRSNIYIAPEDKDKNKSIISVNTRYIFNVKFKGTIYNEHASGNTFFVGSVPEESRTISFNTTELGFGKTDATGVSIKCFSKGILENKILDMVSN